MRVELVYVLRMFMSSESVRPSGRSRRDLDGVKAHGRQGTGTDAV